MRVLVLGRRDRRTACDEPPLKTQEHYLDTDYKIVSDEFHMNHRKNYRSTLLRQAGTDLTNGRD